MPTTDEQITKADIAECVLWEEVKSEGYGSGSRECLGRGRVPGGWIYEFSRWHNTSGSQPFAVFVPDAP